LKYVLLVFVDSMTVNVRAEFDELVEKYFVGLRSTKNKEFLRTNFKGGATSLSMLNSHHWPGMAFSFLLTLLTEAGSKACTSCFQEEDVVEPVVDWAASPPVDFGRYYTPPNPLNEQNLEAPDGDDAAEPEADGDDDDAETEADGDDDASLSDSPHDVAGGSGRKKKKSFH
jgi:hypothetical protein